MPEFFLRHACTCGGGGGSDSDSGVSARSFRSATPPGSSYRLMFRLGSSCQVRSYGVALAVSTAPIQDVPVHVTRSCSCSGLVVHVRCSGFGSCMRDTGRSVHRSEAAPTQDAVPNTLHKLRHRRGLMHRLGFTFRLWFMFMESHRSEAAATQDTEGRKVLDRDLDRLDVLGPNVLVNERG